MMRLTRFSFYCFSLLFVLLWSCSHKKQTTTTTVNLQQDTISKLIQLAKDTSIPVIERIKIATNASKIAETHQLHILKHRAFRRLSNLYHEKGDTTAYFNINKKLMVSAENNKDSISIARAHFNLGEYYGNKNHIDSSFFHFYNASEIYFSIKDSLYTAKSLLNLAISLKNAGDILGSEDMIISALQLTNSKKRKHTYTIGSIYNHLGITSRNLEQYDDAIKYHNEAIYYREKASQEEEVFQSLNNIGYVHLEDKAYDKALAYFKQVIDNTKNKGYVKVHAVALDNYAYTQFKKDPKSFMHLDLFIRSLELNIRHNYKNGIVTNYHHLAEYYKFLGQPKAALDFTLKGLTLAKENVLIEDQLLLLKLATELSNPKISNRYYQTYIRINDSIAKVQQTQRNQFTKIRFESEKKEKEIALLNLENYTKAQKIKTQKRNTFIFFVLSILLLSALVFAVLYLKQRQRTQKKTLLIEKLRERERERVAFSKTLHDDLGNQLYLIMSALDILNEKYPNKEIETIVDDIEVAYQKIRKISQQLSGLDFSKISFEKYVDGLLKSIQNEDTLTIELYGLNEVLWETISDEIRVEFYRILQEALVNIKKHANASMVVIQFKNLEPNIELIIKDNGSGFKKNHTKGIGLINIESRVKDLEGTFTIENNSNGVTLTITIPS